MCWFAVTPTTGRDEAALQLPSPESHEATDLPTCTSQADLESASVSPTEAASEVPSHEAVDLPTAEAASDFDPGMLTP